jgi:membrane associated rhomboid family serine protease
MIPLRDLHPTSIRPVVTWTLIGLNVLLFVATFRDLQAAAWRLGAIAFHLTGLDPAPLTEYGPQGAPISHEPPPREWWFPATAITHMFVHGGVLHILGNMWFLHVFGDNVEEHFGRVKYLAFYLGGGLVALIAQIAADPHSAVPMVGASGAVSGVLGAYMRMFPREKIVTLVPLGFFFFTMLWSAQWFLGVWIGLQLLQAAVDPGGAGGVAWWAHIGGFVLGWLVAPALRRREPPRRWDRMVP